MAATAKGLSAKRFRARYGPWALVTGAAQGIGRAFADALATRGLHVVLIDVQSQAIATAAREIAALQGVETRNVAADLSDREFIDEVLAQVADLEIGLVICNAAIGQEGPFLEEPLDALHRAIDVNCSAAVTLTRAFAPAMLERGRGGLILIASGTALQGSPNYANYAATKAFNLSLGESLHYELREQGVDVLSYVPGPTNTPGLRSSLPKLKEGVEVGSIRLARPTAEKALKALGTLATAARQPEHSRRLAARRRRAELAIEARHARESNSPGADG